MVRDNVHICMQFIFFVATALAAGHKLDCGLVLSIAVLGNLNYMIHDYLQD